MIEAQIQLLSDMMNVLKIRYRQRRLPIPKVFLSVERGLQSILYKSHRRRLGMIICSLQFFKEFVIATELPNVLGPVPEEGRPMPPVRLS